MTPNCELIFKTINSIFQ